MTDLLGEFNPRTRSPAGDLVPEQLRVLRSKLDLDVWKGLRVGLLGPSWLVAKWLALLDGVAGSLLLIPADTAPELADRFLRSSGTDLLVTDLPQERGVPVLCDSDIFAPLAKPACRPVAGWDGETRWQFTTSGTTSTPKVVEHTLASLARASSRKSRAGALTWGLMYDICRFAGIQVALQAWTTGGGLVIPSNTRNIPVALAELIAAGTNAISATPSIWRQILMSPSAPDLPLKQITLGGEIADRVILSALRQAYPAAHMTHVYASTEAGVGFTVHDGQPGFPAEWLDEKLLKVNSEGRLCIRSSGSAARYIGTDAAIRDRDGWVDTGDLVEINQDRVYFLGRANGAINVGGNKVYPEEVESIIREIEGVRDVQVFGRRNPFTGELVEALVVPGELKRPDLIASIAASCRSRLPPFKVPARIRLVDSLEVSHGGKRVRTRP